MEDVKYRVWDKVKKKFINNVLIAVDGSIYCFYGLNPPEIVEQDDYILQLYTGLKDKNRKDIYEGDILKHEKHWSDNRTQSVAEMTSPFYCGDWSVKAEDCEIIGNISENPE